MTDQTTTGHLLALLTILIWGTTFISTKVLLVTFQPVEILFFRFLLGLLALFLVYPRRLKGRTASRNSPWLLRGCAGSACTICWKISP